MRRQSPTRLPTQHPVILCLALVCVLAAPLTAHADVVELTNGVRIVGKVKEATAASVVLEVHGKEVRIRPDRVRSMTFEAEQPPEKPAPGASITYTTAAPAQRPVPPNVAAALAVLDGLQAATAKALPSADYAARIEQVKREVEQALGASSDDTDGRGALAAAIHYHQLAPPPRRPDEAR